MYELITSTQVNSEDDIYDFQVIKYTDDSGQVSWIPIDENNSDYQTYLLSLQLAKKLNTCYNVIGYTS